MAKEIINMNQSSACHFYHALKQVVILAGFSFYIQSSFAVDTYNLDTLMSLALQEKANIGAAAAQEEAAKAGITTAQAYQNPSILAGVGPSTYRSGSNQTKSNWGINISQPIEFGELRGARASLAESGLKLAASSSEVNRAEIRALVRSAYYTLIQRQSEVNLYENEKALLSQIRDRVKLRVEVGESPKYELIKAETEVLSAERDYLSASVRIEEAKAKLRGAVGGAIVGNFEVNGKFPSAEGLPAIEVVREKIASSPLLQQAKVVSEAARAKLRLEENLRNPGITVNAGVEQDPDLTSWRVGVAIPLPLWNRREGPIAEAAAGVKQADALINARELQLTREAETAYQRYIIAKQQVAAYENGLLSQSEAVLKVAEAAYRYGERGILDYLDAQRTYRSVRKDYIAARSDLMTTVLDIERLVGVEFLEEK